MSECEFIRKQSGYTKNTRRPQKQHSAKEMTREVRHEAHHRKEEACSALGGRTRGQAQGCDGQGGGRHPAALSHHQQTPRCSVLPPFGVPAAHYHAHLRRGEMHAWWDQDPGANAMSPTSLAPHPSGGCRPGQTFPFAASGGLDVLAASERE